MVRVLVSGIMGGWADCKKKQTNKYLFEIHILRLPHHGRVSDCEKKTQIIS